MQIQESFGLSLFELVISRAPTRARDYDALQSSPSRNVPGLIFARSAPSCGVFGVNRAISVPFQGRALTSVRC